MQCTTSVVYSKNYHSCGRAKLMNKELSLNEKLSDAKDLLSKLKIAVYEGELVLWEDKLHPPNLSKEEFLVFLSKVRKPLNEEFVSRKSYNGIHGKTGERDCFQFEKEISLFGKLVRFYLKGFFFDRNDLKGVEIQSFRKIKR